MVPRINIKITAAVQLYREKLNLRSRQDIPDLVNPLPQYATRLKDNLSADDRRLFLNGLVYWLATGGMRIAREHNRRFQFVCLIFLGGEHIRPPLYVRCAYRKVLASIPAGACLTAQFDNFHMTQQCILAPDTWTPLAFVCDPEIPSVLASNARQLLDPLYFLDTRHCRTTSGFLNFMGTLFLLENDERLGDALNKVDDWLKDAMSEEYNEWFRWVSHSMTVGRITLDFNRILVNTAEPERWYFDSPTAFRETKNA